MNNENMPVITDREELYDKCENMEQLFDKYYLPLLYNHYSKVYQLQQENKKLKKQLEYLRSGEYYNQLRFENEMLQQVVDTNGVPSEVYDYIDCTHRNTELLEENQELKKQLEERPKEYVFIGNAQNKTRDFINQITKDNKEFKNQQKEFIKYMNKTIEELECDDVDDEEMKGYLIQRIDIFKEILKKYNEKVTDINVGSIGDKRK